MVRFLSLTTWLCTTLGAALLACSVMLVPENLALGDEGGGTGLMMCAEDIPCDRACSSRPVGPPRVRSIVRSPFTWIGVGRVFVFSTILIWPARAKKPRRRALPDQPNPAW